MTNALGNTWSYGHDSYGNLQSTTDPLGFVSTQLWGRGLPLGTISLSDSAGRMCTIRSRTALP